MPHLRLTNGKSLFIIYRDIEIRPICAKEGATMDNKLFARILCIVLAGVMVLGLVAMVIPMLTGA